MRRHVGKKVKTGRHRDGVKLDATIDKSNANVGMNSMVMLHDQNTKVNSDKENANDEILDSVEAMERELDTYAKKKTSNWAEPDDDDMV